MPVGKLLDGDFEGGVLIPGIGKSDVLLGGVVEGRGLGVGGVADCDEPAGVEVILRSRLGRGRGNGAEQEEGGGAPAEYEKLLHGRPATVKCGTILLLECKGRSLANFDFSIGAIDIVISVEGC